MTHDLSDTMLGALHHIAAGPKSIGDLPKPSIRGLLRRGLVEWWIQPGTVPWPVLHITEAGLEVLR